MRIIALGFFDGVHLGHGTLLRTVRTLADQTGSAACALTFDCSPRSALHGGAPELLSTLHDRERLMRELYGIDEILCQHFDDAYRQMPCDAFVHGVLQKELGACHVVCGHDYRFGAGGVGTPTTLKALCDTLGIGCTCLPQLVLDGQPVSSSYIRELLRAGDMPRAVQFLGHPYRMSGEIVHGHQFGQTIGIPTANLAYAPELLLPASGVYAVRAQLDGAWHTGVCNIGARPTVGGTHVTVETWLSGISGDQYGKLLTLEFYRRLREERKFDTFDALREEILNNRAQAEEYFRSIKKN